MDGREQRGMEIAATLKISRNGTGLVVPSLAGTVITQPSLIPRLASHSKLLQRAASNAAVVAAELLVAGNRCPGNG